MGFVEANGVQFWVEESGAGTPLVLMHAAAGHGGCWAEQRPMFERAGFRVVAYDLRGFGKTRAAGGENAEGSMAGDLEDLTEKLGLDRFCLVATAYGGFGALEFALDNPDRLMALVVSTSFGGLTDPEFTAMRARHVRPDLAHLPTAEKELGASYRASNPDGVKRFEAMEHGSYKGDGARQSLRTPTTLSRLEGMRVPAMIIAGDEDAYAPPPVMRAFAEHIPGAEFRVIAGAGHSAYWEKPEEWNEAVREFLSRHALKG
jgi:pimeloyl-ACP methyl ester carboxylesterase